VTLDRDGGGVGATSLLFGPAGELLAECVASTPTGAPQRIEPTGEPATVVGTGIGRLSLDPAGDGERGEPLRSRALAGAQVVVTAFGPSGRGRRLAARAAENKVWVIGGGRIIGPDGKRVASAGTGPETIVVADIDPARADDKTRPDGTDLFLARRPELYTATAARPRTGRRPAAARRVLAAVVRPAGSGMNAIERGAALVRRAVAEGAELMVLPEMFFYPDGRADGSFVDGFAVAALTDAVAGTPSHVVTSVPDDGTHVGILVGSGGVIGRQPQLHAAARHVGWQASLGDRVRTFDLPWGRLVIVVGDDALYPETFGLARIAEADAVAVPCTPAEGWELPLALPARAAEHRFAIIAAGHSGPRGGGAIIAFRPAHADSGPVVTRVASTDRLVTGEFFPAYGRGVREGAGDLDRPRPAPLDGVTGGTAR
jgi:predicted amidohydrolase